MPAAAGQLASFGAPPQKPKDDPPQFRWDGHPVLLLSKDIRLDFKARFQWDLRDSETTLDATDTDGIDLVRRRVGVDGRVGDLLDFQIEAELRPDTPWRDVYANFRRFEQAEVRGGQFKLPFGLEENTSSTNLDFVYRAMASSRLAPGRDQGVMVHGRLQKRRLRYEAGLFRGDGDNARPNNPERRAGGTTLAARLTAQPFRGGKSVLADFQAGAAFMSSDVDEGVIGVRARTVLGSSFFAPDIFLNGPRSRLGFEGRWRPGPASIKAEYIRLSSARQGQSVESTDLTAFQASGWYVSGTYALTGESKADGLDTPRRPLLRGGPGAIEVAARVERLAFGASPDDPDASTSPRAEVVRGNADRAVTLGVNWHPIRWFKVQTNVVYETFTDPGQGPLPARAGFWSRILRFQFAM